MVKNNNQINETSVKLDHPGKYKMYAALDQLY